MTQFSRIPLGQRAPRLLAVLSALAALGCTASFVDPRVPAGEEKSEWLDFYLIGAVGRERVDARDHCQSGRAREVRVGGNVLTLGVSLLTLGIYTPRKATITCAATPPSAAGPPPNAAPSASATAPPSTAASPSAPGSGGPRR